MQLSELSLETLEKIKSVRWDRIIEKHEGPERWSSVLEYYEPEFLTIEGRSVLLPVEKSHHPNMTILRTIFSQDGKALTLFLKDTTYDDHWSASGFMAVCEKVGGEEFFLATLYHEWFIIERSPVFEA
jgi:hypothetical protein